jgi:anthranilate phosphoribosyltransferase
MSGVTGTTARPAGHTAAAAPAGSAATSAAAGPVAAPAPDLQPAAGQTIAFPDALKRLAEKRDLTREEAASVLDQLISGDLGDAQVAAFLMGLRVKGETADEIAGLADGMRRAAITVDSVHHGTLVDVVGTGGDSLGTFNISTTAAFVAAGAGVKIAKHGNRAASSACGSADVLEALGIQIALGPAEVAACIDEVGMGFMLASLHHPAAGRVAGVRRALGVRTVFNLLGPLTNPAGVRRQLLGVSTPQYLHVLGDALARMGCDHALVVCGDLGMDELSVTGTNRAIEVTSGVSHRSLRIDPEDCGLSRYPLEALKGGDAATNAAITRDVLGGMPGGPRDAVLMNAAAALYVAGKALSLPEGVDLARTAIDSGRALEVLEQMVTVTNRLAQEGGPGGPGGSNDPSGAGGAGRGSGRSGGAA